MSRQPDWDIEDDPFHMAHTARFNISVANEALKSLQQVSFKKDKARWYLYFSSGIIFGRAALDALQLADGIRNRVLGEQWKELFETDVKQHDIFKYVLDIERHTVAHGKLGAAFHPHWPLDTVFRHGGIDAVFGDPPCWPDGPFKGQSAVVVLATAIRQAYNWIEEVDVRTEKIVGPYIPGRS